MTKNCVMAKADATYEVAKERCDDLSGNAKDVCKKDAKAAFDDRPKSGRESGSSADKDLTQGRGCAALDKAGRPNQ